MRQLAPLEKTSTPRILTVMGSEREPAGSPAKTPQTEVNEKPATSSGGVPVEVASPSKLVPFGWTLFTMVWLLFSVGFIVQVLGRGSSPIGTLAFLASMVAFVSMFVWLMLRYPFPDPGLTLRGLRARLGLLMVLAVLAFYVELVYGGGVPWRFMYVVVASAVILPTRYAASAVLAVTVFSGMFYAVRSGWEDLAAHWGNLVPFALIGMGMIAVGRLVVTVAELRTAREEIARLAVAEERLRFARDLHDLLGHSLSQITLKSELAGRLLPETPETEKTAKEIRDIEDVARKALGEVREAVSGYRQPALDGELKGAREMLEAAGISWWIENRAGVLPNGTDSVLGWAVREGVTNVIRHSRAKRCQIRVRQGGREICAEVTDDGVGSTSEHEGPVAGNGLSGLAERVARNGGNFEAGPLPEGGFALRVSLPLRADEDPTNSDASGQQ